MKSNFFKFRVTPFSPINPIDPLFTPVRKHSFLSSSLNCPTFLLRTLHIQLTMSTRTEKFWDVIGEDVTQWTLDRVIRRADTCICSAPIKLTFLFRHERTNQCITLGQCCARKIGTALTWRSKSDYLANALLMVSSSRLKTFVRSIQNRLPQWGSRLRITRHQAHVLESITGHPWHWKVWEDYHK